MAPPYLLLATATGGWSRRSPTSCRRIAYFHNSFFTSDPAERLAEDLLRDAPPGLSEVLFCSGGSEAMESALKLTRQYWVEKGEPQRTHVISRRQSYHGATLGALSIGGNAARRELYTPLLFPAVFIDPCYAYRHQKDGETLEDYGLRAADQLAVAIESLGAGNVAAFVAEPVVGATLGCAPAVDGYLRRIREICDRYNVLLILDEIMCGLGRVGERYACSQDGVVPDLLTLAKGLGGGFQPIGAVLVHQRVGAAIRNGSGTLKHGLTYMAHPVACAAALAVQTVIREEGLIANVRSKSAALRGALRDALGAHPHVGDIRGARTVPGYRARRRARLEGSVSRPLRNTCRLSRKQPWRVGCWYIRAAAASTVSGGIMCWWRRHSLWATTKLGRSSPGCPKHSTPCAKRWLWARHQPEDDGATHAIDLVQVQSQQRSRDCRRDARARVAGRCQSGRVAARRGLRNASSFASTSTAIAAMVAAASRLRRRASKSKNCPMPRPFMLWSTAIRPSSVTGGNCG